MKSTKLKPRTEALVKEINDEINNSEINEKLCDLLSKLAKKLKSMIDSKKYLSSQELGSVELKMKIIQALKPNEIYLNLILAVLNLNSINVNTIKEVVTKVGESTPQSQDLLK